MSVCLFICSLICLPTTYCCERVAELQAALSNVKKLHGLLPICSYCKRIRGDDQYWQQVEGTSRNIPRCSSATGSAACYVTVSAELDAISRSKRRTLSRMKSVMLTCDSQTW